MQQQHYQSKKIMPWVLATLVILLGLVTGINVKHHHAAKIISQQLALPEINDTNPIPAPPEEDTGWRTITARKGDTLGRIFNREGLSQQTLQAILHSNPYAKNITTIKPNQQIQILVQDNILEKMIFRHNATQLLVVSLQKNNYITTLKNRTMDTHQEYVTATLRGSLYGTASRKGIPYKLIRQMVDIFHWEIDFTKEVRAGDQFSILYQAQYVDDTLVNTGDILALSYTNRGVTLSAVRYKTGNGEYDYFTPDGKSLKKAFSRYPIQFTHISSTFSLSRRHPILHYNRPHKGVDLAAPIGTPIRATGDGIIAQIGRQSAYGNMIKITHSNMYASLYGHLLRFQKGLSRGTRVKRGQIIGYVGQSGLATGPHCHYEFHVYQQPRNPTTIALPHADPIAIKNLGAFQMNANQLLATLKLFESGQMIASRSSQTPRTG